MLRNQYCSTSNRRFRRHGTAQGLANRVLRQLEDVGSLAQLLVATVARRHADPTDRRRVLVDLTPTAQAAMDRLLPEVQQAVTAVMGALDDWASTPPRLATRGWWSRKSSQAPSRPP
jgi:hypothetical protein